MGVVKIIFYGQNISIYINFGGDGGGCKWSTLHFFFIIKKTEKVQKHDLTLIKFYIILIKKIPRMNKKNKKRRPQKVMKMGGGQALM